MVCDKLLKVLAKFHNECKKLNLINEGFKNKIKNNGQKITLNKFVNMHTASWMAKDSDR